MAYMLTAQLTIFRFLSLSLFFSRISAWVIQKAEVDPYTLYLDYKYL